MAKVYKTKIEQSNGDRMLPVTNLENVYSREGLNGEEMFTKYVGSLYVIEFVESESNMLYDSSAQSKRLLLSNGLFMQWNDLSIKSLTEIDGLFYHRVSLAYPTKFIPTTTVTTSTHYSAVPLNVTASYPSYYTEQGFTPYNSILLVSPTNPNTIVNHNSATSLITMGVVDVKGLELV